MTVSAKIIVVVVGLFCAVITPQVNGSPEIMERCMSESGATKEMLMDFMQGQNDSYELKCFFKCTMTVGGKMDEDGTFNMEAMKEVQTPALYKVASTTCADFQSADLCEKAYAHVACLRDNAEEEFRNAMMRHH